MQHLISIITPAMNAERTLAEALESALAGNNTDIEYLLIDACSLDGTLAVASRYPQLKITSEPDHGIYDGMNKGASLASGEWLLFLQADDWLPEGTLAAYREAIRDHPSAVMISGGAEAVREVAGGWDIVWNANHAAQKKLTLEQIALGEPMINARLIRRDYFVSLGGFSLDYSLASDRDFLLRSVSSPGLRLEIPSLTYRYRWHAGSSTMTEGNQLTDRLSSENLRIAKQHLAVVKGREKRPLKKWHTRLTVQSAMNALENFQCRRLLRSVAEGSSADGWWPFHFMAEFARSLPGFLVRGGRTKSNLLRCRQLDDTSE